MPGSVKAIIPPDLDADAMMKVLADEFKRYAPFLVKDFERTTRQWSGAKPAFTPKAIIQGNVWQMQVKPSGNAEGVRKWIYLDEGTRPHVIRPKGNYPLRFRTGYQAGSSPRSLVTTTGRATGPEVRAREVHHPGTRAREWSETIAKTHQPQFERWMDAAMGHAAKASGHSSK